MASKIYANNQERILRNCTIDESTGCWEWDLHYNPGGYGIGFNGKKTVKAHRLSYEVFIGEIPEGLLVCHSCDNRGCVNPDHLWLGTYADNNADRDNKNRLEWRRGERHGMAKLSEDDVVNIIEILNGGEVSQAAIARMYSVTRSAIWLIAKGKKWAHIPRERSTP